MCLVVVTGRLAGNRRDMARADAHPARVSANVTLTKPFAVRSHHCRDGVLFAVRPSKEGCHLVGRSETQMTCEWKFPDEVWAALSEPCPRSIDWVCLSYYHQQQQQANFRLSRP